ncbi:MAG: hypothetical protein ACRDNF_23175 [Streptosporangiaceae bacterium]
MTESAMAGTIKDRRVPHRLRQVFPDGEIFLVSDDEWLDQVAASYGLPGIPLAEAGRLPRTANVVLFLRHVLVSTEVRRMFPDAAVMCVPVASFDPGLEISMYTHKLTMLTDYAAACEQSNYWADSVRRCTGPVIFSSETGDTGDGDAAPGSTHLVCGLSDEVTADAWLERSIRPGQWVSVGALCEFSIIPPSPDDWRGALTIDGTAVASGVLTARDARRTEAGDGRIRAAGRLRRELAVRRPVTLRLDGGVLTSVTAGGEDFTEALREVTNPAYGLQALELGIGTNQSVLPLVRWDFNSQLNEGAGPVHLGFGDGRTGAHMDFVVADCSHHFAAAADASQA